MGEYLDLRKPKITDDDLPDMDWGIESDPMPWDKEEDGEKVHGAGGSGDSVGEAADEEHDDEAEERDDLPGLEGVSESAESILQHIEEVIDNLRNLRSRLIWAKSKDKDILWGEYGYAIERCRRDISGIAGK
jgi:hypothetical protein